jgi:hypothetical protein
VKKSPYLRAQPSRNGIGRTIHSHIWIAAGRLGPGGRALMPVI